jgi:ankyrin repeat protein
MKPEWKDAVRRGSVEALQRLLSETDVDACDKYGQTALMIAAKDGRGEVVAWLIERGCDLNHTAKYGLSALMLAVIGGHAGVARQLKNAGADVTLRGTGAPGFAGKTALDLAIARDDHRIIEILRPATTGLA